MDDVDRSKEGRHTRPHDAHGSHSIDAGFGAYAVQVGNHVVFRYLLGWLCPPKVTFLKLPTTPALRREMMTQRVYQDIVLPLRELEPSIARAERLFGIWPILVYPSRVHDHGPNKQGVRGRVPKAPLRSRRSAARDSRALRRSVGCALQLRRRTRSAERGARRAPNPPKGRTDGPT